MAVQILGTGGLYPRLAAIGKEYLRTVNTYGTALNSGVAAIDQQFASGQQVVLDGLYSTRESYRGVHGGYLGQLAALTQNTIIEQVNDDTPLASKSLTTALTELIAQMKASSDTIQRPTISATVTADGSNKGDAVVNVSLINEFGDPLDLVFAESVKLTCSTAGTAFSETLAVAGQPARQVTDYLWPGGSGASGSVAITDAATGTFLTNGSLNTWSGSPLAPDGWTLLEGTAGTDIIRSSDPIRAGTSFTARFVSNGTLLHKIYQTVSLQPNVVYALNLFAKINTVDSSGTFRVRLTDGANTVLTDDAGNNLQATWGVNGGSGIGTSYTKLATFFSTPRQLPSTVRLHSEMSASPTSGRTVNFGLVGFTGATQLYPGGPYVAAFSKGTTNPTAVRDFYTIAVANNATTASFTKHLDRVLNLRQNRLYLPSNSSPTVSNSLLT